MLSIATLANDVNPWNRTVHLIRALGSKIPENLTDKSLTSRTARGLPNAATVHGLDADYYGQSNFTDGLMFADFYTHLATYKNAVLCVYQHSDSVFELLQAIRGVLTSISDTLLSSGSRHLIDGRHGRPAACGRMAVGSTEYRNAMYMNACEQFLNVSIGRLTDFSE